MRRAAILACAALALRASAALADDAEDVTVRGSRGAGFVGVAKEGDTPREVTDAASLIEALPGVHVRRLGADDGFATLSIRGTASTQAAILLAGVPLSGGADPTVDLSTLPLWPGARAKVYRSFAPASLGQGSLGGTLTLDPALAKDAARTEVWSALGSFGSARLRAGDVREVGGGVRLATGVSASRADDDFSFVNPSQGPSDPRATLTEQNARHADANALASLSAPVALGGGKQGYWRATTVLSAREQHLPGTLYVPTPFARLSTDRELLGVELGADGVFARAWGRREGRRLTDVPAARPLDATLAESAIVAAGGAFGFRGRAAKTARLEALVDGRGERFAPGAYVGPTPTRGAARAALGAGADLEWTPAPSLALDASGRLDVWHDASDDPTIDSSTEIRPTAHLGAEWRRGPLTLDAHGGATARPPNFAERFGSSGGAIPNPALRTETAWTADLGAHLSGKSGPLRARAELVGFGTWATDLIVFVPIGSRGLPRAENIDSARILGIEATALAKLAGAQLAISYTGLASVNQSACPQGTCPQLPGRPAHDVTLDASYGVGPATVRYGLDALAGMTADPAGTIVVPDRLLQSVGARYVVRKGTTLAMDVRNLFDVRTADYPQAFNGTVKTLPLGDAYLYPLPGRSFLISLRISSD